MQLTCNLARPTASMLRSMLLFGGSGGSMATDPHGLHARLSALSRAHLPDLKDAKRQRDEDAEKADHESASRQQGRDDTSEKGGGELDMMWEDRWEPAAMC
jgi:hypothetical protein